MTHILAHIVVTVNHIVGATGGETVHKVVAIGTGHP